MIQQFNLRTLMRMCFVCAVLASLVSTTFAQNSPAGSRNKELRKIDSKATKMDEQFVRNAFEMATAYEEAGDVARAVDYLHAMSLVKPGLTEIEGKLKQLREEVLAANVYSFEHEPSTSWGKPVAFVQSGKPFRIDVQGGYKAAILSMIGPDGFAESKTEGQSKVTELTELTDMIDDAPLGKLIGVIVEEKSGPSKKGDKKKDKNKLVPFEIGKGRDVRPRQTGYLFLKVNLPQESNPRGSLQVQLSGYVLAPDGQNIGN